MSKIYGIGTDLVFIPRIRKMVIKFNERFALRILSDREFKKYDSILELDQKINFLAKRFAAKEALSKALGCGIGKTLSFKDISILNHPSGAPWVLLSTASEAKFTEKFNFFVSLSDDNEYAQAFVVASVS